MLLTGGLLTGQALWVLDEYSSSIELVQTQEKTISRAIEENISQVLDSQREAAELTAAELEPRGSRRLATVVEHRLMTDDGLRAILYLSHSGRVLGSTQDRSIFPSSFAENPDFQRLMSGPQEAVYFAPVQSPGSEKYFLSVGVRTPAGGAVLSVIWAEYLNRYFDSLELPGASIVAVMRSDGPFIFRHPFVREVLGSPVVAAKNKELFGPLKPGQETQLNVKSPIDGVARIGFMRSSPRFPIITFVGIPRNLVLKAWKNASFWRLVITILFIWVALSLLQAVERRDSQAEALKNHVEQRASQAHKMEALGTLAGGIAHDFNNLLSIIQGSVEAAQLAPELAGNPFLTRVEKACFRGEEMVRKILAFSRNQPSTKTKVSLRELLSEFDHLIAPSLSERQKLELEMAEGEDFVILGNVMELQQVLHNLCRNAFQSMGGNPLAVTRLEVSHSVAGNRTGSFVRIAVTDHGHGMPPEILQRVFEPFFTTKPQGEGTGLGLSMVHGIVRDHGGFIEVESRVGEGTRFEVLLPVVIAG